MPVLARTAGGMLYFVFACNSFRVNDLRRIAECAAAASTLDLQRANHLVEFTDRP